MTRSNALAGIVLLAVLGGAVFTQEPAAPSKGKDGKGPAAKKAAPPKKPPVHKVEKKPFRIELTVKGVLEGEAAAEIAYRPYPFVIPPPSQGALTIRQIAEHGSTVRKGDVLVAFDTRKLAKVLGDTAADLKGVEAALKVAEEELPLFEKSVPVELEEAERAHKRAAEDLKYFLEVDRPERKKRADFLVRTEGFFLEYAKEELRQLEKMYKANDLTEETEEIILRRQRHMVETAAFFLRMAEIQRDYVLKVSLPRQEKDLRQGLVKHALQLEKARKTLAPQADQKRLALSRMRRDRDQKTDRLAKFRAERDALTIRAPADGVVYHGKFHQGHWDLSAGQESKLAVDGTVQPGEVFLTVVKTRPLVLRLQVAEKDVHLLKPGLAGKVKVLFRPDLKLPARVTKVSPLPATPGKYEAAVALDAGAGGAELMPGMGCSVKFVPYANKDALAVPSGCVVEEDDKSFVVVVHKDGKKERREVTPGRASGGRTEVVSGLREGEEVLLEPADKSAKGGDQ
jgi:multidrug efflux pump subunit AcrA (membrane-fusion protein)